ncbi:amidase [Pseudonocardia sp. H11422]|uniref:amidase n=1 Tax=Pseudonocardia sp. H11422 TaxID=2835866 RepID=UPI001BDDAFCC|nr:amidase [Pseudonocardia sp. H11422]
MSAPAHTSADLAAIDLLAAYRTGELSPVEATRDALDRIDRLDGAVNAFCLVDADGALAAAKESEQRWRRAEPRGLLDGVPTSIKDILLTIGWPTRRGSRTTPAYGVFDVDGPPVARVREHGAVLLGKTTTPELAWKGVTDSALTGVTGNPWDPTLTAGGSSGGSAAAVGLGMGALSLGTDGGGSVRIPAAFTGTVAHKPTYGRVPHHPASPFGTLAHVGPMTRTAADAALLLDVISGFDARDPWAFPAPARSFTAALADGVAGLQIAVSSTLGYATVDPEVVAAFEAAADVFAALGATVEYADPGFADPVEPFELLWFAGAAKTIEHLGPEQRATMEPALVEIAEQGARASALDYLTAMAVRNELGTLMGTFHRTYDLLLTPTLPIQAFTGGLEVPPGSPSPRWTSWTPFTYPFNMTQQPAASVPCGFTAAGLPVGLQIVGPRHADGMVLTAAHAFQQATGWHRRRPPLLASL